MMFWTCDNCDFRLDTIDPGKLLDHISQTGHSKGRLNFDPLLPDTETGRTAADCLAADLRERVRRIGMQRYVAEVYEEKQKHVIEIPG